MRIKTFIWLLFWAILLLGLSFILLFRLQRETKVLDAIPSEAQGALYLPSASKFMEQMNYASWWPSLQKSEFFGDVKNDIALLDTMLNMSGLSRNTKDLPAAIVLLEGAGGEPGFVFFAGVGRNFSYWDLHERALPAFGNRFELIKRKTVGHSTFLLIDRGNRRQLNYAFIKGLAIASFNREAFERALDALINRNDNKSVVNLPDKKAAAADAIVAVNPSRLSPSLSGLFTGQWATALNNIAGRLDSWIVLDLHVRENELMLNGLADMNSVFDGVDAEGRVSISTLRDVLPINTLSFKARHHRENRQDGGFNGVSGLVVQGMAIVSGAHKPFILYLPDRPETVADIVFNRQPRIPSPWNGLWTAPVDIGFLAGKIFRDDSNSLSERNFVTSDGSLFLFSSDLLLLRAYLDARSKNLVNSDIDKLTEEVSSHSGFMLYHQLSKAAGRLSEVSGNKLKYRLLRDAAALHGFESVSLQLSRANEKIYFSTLIRGNANPVGQAIPLWSARLDAPGAAAPYMFMAEGEGRVVAFDSAGWMYGFSPEGRQLWKRQIGGIPLGTPVMVNHPGLKRPHFLINTSVSVFLTDANGKSAAGFPLLLPSRSTAALSYAENNTAIYVNCADRRTYAFNLSGKPVAAWSAPLLSDISTMPPVIAAAGEATYVLITSMDGRLKILDDSGLERIRLKEPLNNAEGAEIYLNRTNARGIFLSSGMQGELLYIGSSGISRSPGPERFSRGHFFQYYDFDADQSPDFMYADGRRVVIFDRYNRVMLEGALPHEVRQKPVFIGGNGRPGIWCFDNASFGHAAIASAESGFLNFSALPKGEKYGFGRTESSGPLLLGGYQKDSLILFSIN
ncbi:MAG: hypothetical protein LWX09_02105 [Bacteroidia bacterium]|nr:hypothetical protein [Bacteroidia bacterium]